MSVTDELLQHNARYASSFEKGGLPAPPACGVAVVACMDARLDVYRLLGLSEGDAHVMRNAGGVVSDDVIRSLTISQLLLGTREVVLVQHTDCGMMTFRDEDVKDRIEADTGLRTSFALEAVGDLEQNVRQSIARLQASPFIPVKDKVRGFVYDCATGLLDEISPPSNEQPRRAPGPIDIPHGSSWSRPRTFMSEAAGRRLQMAADLGWGPVIVSQVLNQSELVMVQWK